ncbi:hypothetical protein H5410_021721 [Solanum commersonii]|uniref:Uncharacterized protein n=1 Tax=Solanum commersonii TaxID=4109 RepID=A0A9J5ZF24_SOLCO|nr:hypothetical protein H5410_021721 [Solanum commersonii]
MLVQVVRRTPSVTHVLQTTKKTPFGPVSTPMKETNVLVHELHNQPNTFFNLTSPMSSKKRQDIKAYEIAVLRQDLALFKNSDRTFQFVLEEHIKDNVQKTYHPVEIHIQDPLWTGDMNGLPNNGIKQPRNNMSCLMFCYLASSQLIRKRVLWFIQRLLLMILHAPVPVQRTRRSGRNSSNVVRIYGKKHPLISDFIRGPYNSDVSDDYASGFMKVSLMHNEDCYKKNKAELTIAMDLDRLLLTEYSSKKLLKFMPRMLKLEAHYVLQMLKVTYVIT